MKRHKRTIIKEPLPFYDRVDFENIKYNIILK